MSMLQNSLPHLMYLKSWFSLAFIIFTRAMISKWPPEATSAVSLQSFHSTWLVLLSVDPACNTTTHSHHTVCCHQARPSPPPITWPHCITTALASIPSLNISFLPPPSHQQSTHSLIPSSSPLQVRSWQQALQHSSLSYVAVHQCPYHQLNPGEAVELISTLPLSCHLLSVSHTSQVYTIIP